MAERRYAEHVARGLVILLAGLALCWLTLAITGGFTLPLRPFSLRVHNATRLAVVTAIVGLVYLLGFTRHAIAHVSWLESHLARLAVPYAAMLAVTAVTAGVAFGTGVASGADSYGYVSQADLWLAGSLHVAQPIAGRVPWPDADWVFAPLGYRPATSGHAIVPTYAPGLPLLMAVFKKVVGADGPFYVVPALGGLAVWLTFWLGARLATPALGVAAAALLLMSPTFLFQLMWPMSDVPVTAFWVLAVACVLGGTRSGSIGAGLSSALAILIRPNLLPLAGVLMIWIWRMPSAATGAATSGGTRALWFIAGVVPGVVAIALVNTSLYGAPWESGYGSLTASYAWSHIWPNAIRHLRWLVETQSPLILASVVALWPRTSPLAPDRRWGIGALVVVLWGIYLPYLVFDGWWFLRFQLPVLPLLIVLAVVGWSTLAGRWLPPRMQGLVLVACVVAVSIYQLAHLSRGPVFRLKQDEARYVDAARLVQARVPPDAVCLSMQHSGSLRYYAGCLTARYDFLPPGELPAALDTFRALGLRPYIVLEGWEEPQFRQRFNLDQHGELPWKLLGEVPGLGRVRVFDAGASSAQSSNR